MNRRVASGLRASAGFAWIGFLSLACGGGAGQRLASLDPAAVIESPGTPAPAPPFADADGPTHPAIVEAGGRLESGDPKGALARLDAADFGVDVPVKIRALRLRAEILERLGQRKEAGDALEGAWNLDPDSPWRNAILDRLLAMAVEHSKSPDRKFLFIPTSSPRDEALVWLERIALKEDRTPRGARARFEISEVYRHAGDLAEAEIRYGEVVRNNPDSPEAPEALFWQGKCLSALWPGPDYAGRILDRANLAFRGYLDDYPDGPRAGDCRRTLEDIERWKREREARSRAYYVRRRPAPAPAPEAKSPGVEPPLPALPEPVPIPPPIPGPEALPDREILPPPLPSPLPDAPDALP
ncbi:MAG: tetratricopeptide repeat protein [Planctomycetota bacterium]|mgnify:CR=1 FL=1